MPYGFVELDLCGRTMSGGGQGRQRDGDPGANQAGD